MSACVPVMSGDSESPAEATDAAEWFYDDGAQPRGPFTLKAIGEMARAGVVASGVPVARDGADGWRPFSEVVGGAPAREVPAPPPEPDPAGPRFRVHLGGLRVPYSKLGFVWGGTLRVEDGRTLSVSGRKQWDASRIAGALASLLVIVPPVVWAIAMVIGFPGGFIARLIERHIPDTVGGSGGDYMKALWMSNMRDYVLGVTMWLIWGFALVAAIMIPVFVASRCMVGRGTGRFTIPDGAVVSRKKLTVTMPLIDEGGRPIKAARITFSDENEAERFVETVTGAGGADT